LRFNIAPLKVMKILLQHSQTLRYLRTVNTWTKDDSDAHDFLHSQKAIDFAHEHDLTDVYVTVKFLGGEREVAAPIPDKSLYAHPRARLY
jgi:hypothetical protein